MITFLSSCVETSGQKRLWMHTTVQFRSQDLDCKEERKKKRHYSGCIFIDNVVTFELVKQNIETMWFWILFGYKNTIE